MPDADLIDRAQDPDDTQPDLKLAELTVTPEMRERIAAVVELHRVHAQHDGGDLALVSIERGIVRVRLTGACTHCALAGQTLGTLRRAVMKATGLPLRVAPG